MKCEFATNAGLRSYESLKGEYGKLSPDIQLKSDDSILDAGLQSLISERKLQSESFIGAKSLRNMSRKKCFVLMAMEDKNAFAWGLEPIWHNNNIIGLVRRGIYSHIHSQPLAIGYVCYDRIGANDMPNSVNLEINCKHINAQILTTF